MWRLRSAGLVGLSLGALGAAVAAEGCGALLGVGELGFGSDADATTSDASSVEAGGADAGCGSKICVVCVDASDPQVGCADKASCAPCPRRPNAESACVGGACGARCVGTFADCNGDAADGCEVDPASGDPVNCGGCGTRCDGGVCDQGRCTPPGVGCGGGRVDCDDAGGCFDLGTAPTHCGACATACPPNPPNAVPTCDAGKCGISCVSSYRDCNGDASDGCEIAPNDTQSCGGCNKPCADVYGAVALCNGTSCSYTCQPDFSDCNHDLGSSSGNGCECAVPNVCAGPGGTQCRPCSGVGGACSGSQECCADPSVTCGLVPPGTAPTCCRMSGTGSCTPNAADVGCCSGACASNGTCS